MNAFIIVTSTEFLRLILWHTHRNPLIVLILVETNRQDSLTINQCASLVLNTLLHPFDNAVLTSRDGLSAGRTCDLLSHLFYPASSLGKHLLYCLLTTE